MESKIIEVILNSNEGDTVLVFKLESGDLSINMESDDSESIKTVFLGLMQQLEHSPVELELKVAKDFDVSTNKLFYDSSVEYIKNLNNELKKLESDEYLIELRKSLV